MERCRASSPLPDTRLPAMGRRHLDEMEFLRMEPRGVNELEYLNRERTLHVCIHR